MSYKEHVREKLQSSAERSGERVRLWEAICEAYEQGGTEQVESRLTEKMENLTASFEELIDKVQKML